MQPGLILRGDCLAYLSGARPACVDLVYADPPFCTGRDFGAWSDRWPSRDAYLDFMRRVLAECRRVLRPTGTMWLHCDPTISHHLRLLMDGAFGERGFRNEIVWVYHGPSTTRRDFPRKHDSLLRYVVGRTWAFNADDVRVPYAPQTRARAAYPARGSGMRAGSTMELLPGGKLPRSVWSICPVGQRRGELTGYPTQKPLALLDRIIRATSNPDDLVLDPFCGSGTTCVAAHRLGRRWVGIDMGAEAVRVSRERLAAAGRIAV